MQNCHKFGKCQRYSIPKSLTIITRWTMADIIIDPIFTDTIIDARIRSTFIHIAQTPWSIKTSRTFTLESINEVNTLSIIGAGMACTFVDVNVAGHSSVTRLALTSVAINSVNTFPTVDTRVAKNTGLIVYRSKISNS